MPCLYRNEEFFAIMELFELEKFLLQNPVNSANLVKILVHKFMPFMYKIP